MTKQIGLLLFIQLLCIQLTAQINVDHLLTESLKDPECIDNLHPRFSWQLITTQPNTMQSAYEIEVQDDKKIVWSSGKVHSDQSVYVPFEGKTELTPGKKYTWKVRVWDQYEQETPWSAPAYFRMAITNWKAQWIESTDHGAPSPIFKTSFHTNKKIAAAIAYITSHGIYEATINGVKTGNGCFTPGFTNYHKRLQFQAYDVTNQLTTGENTIEVTLGNGWYRGSFAWGNDRYGKTLGLLYQMEVTYTDGSRETIVSNDQWKTSTGKIIYAELYHGEIQDNRIEPNNWVPAKVMTDMPMTNLVATVTPAVTKQEIITHYAVVKTKAGETVLDFGQNLAGFIHFKATGKAGDSLIIEHGEILDNNGNFYNANLRTAKAKDVFILNGKGEEFFEQHFTYHGFRYIRIKGLDKIKVSGLEAVVLHSDLPATGSFECSDPLVNQLQHNILWSQKGNFVDIPTDCPQRDERLGWAGDAQAFCLTAAFNANVNTFFAKWLKDLAADQLKNGSVPHVVPNVMGDGDGAAGWADAATVVPWAMYQVYGDKKVLEDQYASMVAWVEYISASSHNHLWDTGAQYGDWLSYKSEGFEARSADTYPYLVTQCYYALSTQNVINAAKVLGKQNDMEKYTALLQKIKAAFCAEYVTPNGRIMSNTQTAYVLALAFDMLPEAQRAIAARNLVENIKSYNYHLTTGFLGTYLLSNTLTRFGYTDIAYSLLLQDTYPSWLYPVTRGATTIWERWDGIKADGTFQSAALNSFNHYAYGAVGDWMYKTIGGINMDTSAVGFKKIIIRPIPGEQMKYGKASYESSYGRISVDWRIVNKRFVMDVEIPANTTAEVYVPEWDGREGRVEKVGAGKYHFESM